METSLLELVLVNLIINASVQKDQNRKVNKGYEIEIKCTFRNILPLEQPYIPT
jgi:hypothetical protein